MTHLVTIRVTEDARAALYDLKGPHGTYSDAVRMLVEFRESHSHSATVAESNP